jgi:hypothetical protein
VVLRLACSSRGTQTPHDLTDAMRAGYPLHPDYVPWVDSHGTRTHDLTEARRACYPLIVKGSMLSSRLLDDVFVSRLSQTRDNIRGVKCSMLSSHLLDDSMLPFTLRILSLV